MCGISGGMSYPLNISELNHVKTLMVLSMLRGFEGSGAISVREKKNRLIVDTVKTELSCAELAVDPDFDEITKSPKIVIAHARAPTKGGSTKEFIHPHRVGHITGVHNGTMFEVMGEKIGDESDSKKVFEALAKHSIEDFIKNSRGAYSLVWVDTKTGTLNFLRNDQRPMVWARLGTGDHASAMFWASEKSMLEYALVTRGNYVASAIRYMSPKPWEHFTFPLDAKNGLFPKEVKQYENPTATPTYGEYHGGKWCSKSEWEKELERLTNETDKNEAKGESEVPLLLSPPRPPYMNHQNHRSTTYYPTSSNRHGTDTALRNPVTLPRVEDILRQRGRQSNVVSFQPKIAGGKMAETLVKRGCCVICDEKPRIFSEIKDATTEEITVFPKIHPIKYGNSGFMQYICEDCVESKNPIALSVLGASLTQSQTSH